MKPVLRLLKAEPVATMAVVSAALGLATILGMDEKVSGAIGVLVGALLAFPVRGAVAPVAHVVATANRAAEDAARTTAERLTQDTVGGRGEITGSALGIATEAAAGAADTALRKLGIGGEDRAA